MSPPVLGVIGWKNSGKTTLMSRLIRELAQRGYTVSVIKHAHVDFDIDHPGRDSFKMREAGACQVILSSPRRFALMRELGGAPEMTLEDLVESAGACDVILVEGYKRDDYPKIEIRRDGAQSREPLLAKFPGVVAIASDRPRDELEALPAFLADDVDSIAEFVVDLLGLRHP